MIKRKSEHCGGEPVIAELPDRTILVTGEVTDALAGLFMASFFALDRKKGDIKIKLYSPGGQVTAGWAIYDTIRGSKNNVLIEAYGEISSIAAIIYLAGDHRKATPECRFMIHDGSADFGELEYKMLRNRVGEFEYLNSRYVDVIAQRTQSSVEVIDYLSKNEVFFSAEESVDYGFTHEVMELE